MLLRNKKLLIAVSILLIAIIILTSIMGRKPIDYTTQIKPIINKNCITCHGGVRQKSGFSLLFREEALGKTKSGKPAIIPGDAEHSELIKRITNHDPEERMPYKHDPLSKENIEIIRRWIYEGAHWGKHWAYVPVSKVDVPEPKTFFNLIPQKSKWALNPVDNFIEQKLKENDLKPSPEADKYTLLRRVSLDIIGMLPPEHLAKKFLEGNSSHDYEELVNSLLASPHYGERWGRHWLDLVRYAETNGHEFDDDKLDAWRYRDYVIRAFNQDVPYDTFVREHVAGDLLKSPRLSKDGALIESPLATNFLWFGEVLNSATDSVKSKADNVDNQLSIKK